MIPKKKQHSLRKKSELNPQRDFRKDKNIIAKVQHRDNFFNT